MFKKWIFASLIGACFPLHAINVFQCAQNALPALNPFCWSLCGFDIEAEALFLFRNNDCSKVEFTSLGIAGPTKLHSRQLDFGWEQGCRITGRAILEGGDAFEIIWMGDFEWKDTHKAKSAANELYSVFSEFGLNPAGGNPETDQASLHRTDYKSSFESIEANYKNYFSFPMVDCVDGVFFYGYRSVTIDEGFELHTIGISEEFKYLTHASNNLYGMQLGLELRVPYSSAITVGAYGKGGVYANFTEQKTRINISSSVDSVKEKKESLRGAWGIEGGFKLIYELCHNIRLETGYEILVFENVALALENFNKSSPLPKQFFEEERKKILENDGHVIYQGITFGAHVCW